MDSHTRTLLGQVGRVVNRLVFLERRAVFEFAGTRLHPSEIHLLRAVQREPEVNATGIAEALGITLGAVSQTLKRLEAKGMVQRGPGADGGNAIRIELTEAGRAAIGRFLDERAALWHPLEAYLGSLSEGERRVVQGFLARLENVVDDLQ